VLLSVKPKCARKKAIWSKKALEENHWDFAYQKHFEIEEIYYSGK